MHDEFPEISTLLSEQKTYYEARAAEYDEWWERRGRYDLGPAGNAAWKNEIRRLEEILDQAGLEGHVLEPASGTGYWTRFLARRVERVTVVDASTAMIAANRRRLTEAGLVDRVEYEEADLLCWTPHILYDAVFLAFFISHLPSVLLDSFFISMASALKPDGCIVIIEGNEKKIRELRDAKQGTIRLDDEVELRTLNDGRTFRIVKRFDTLSDLSQRLSRAGLPSHLGTSGEQFLYAIGKRQNP